MGNLCRRGPRLRHPVLGQPCVRLSAGGPPNLGIIQGNMQRRRLMRPPRPVLAQLAWEVLTTSPTDEEIHLLIEVVEEAQEQNLEPAEIETRLRGSRIWHWLKVIAKKMCGSRRISGCW